MEVEQIIQLIDAVSKAKLGKFELEEGNVKINIEGQSTTVVQMPAAVQAPVAPAVAAVQAMAPATPVVNVADTAAVAADDTNCNIVKSPLVGVFYCAKSPGADPFVKVGDTVKKGQVLGIIEAMKLMNEIECEYDGVVEEVLVENEDVIEFGQPLFKIR